MSGVNKVILIGRLGKDPEVRAFENNVKKAAFTLATSEVRKDKEGNRIESTEWHNIVCWRNLAEIAEQFLTKGKQIYLEGKIRTRSWEENGGKRYITEIEASTFTMLGSKDENRPTETQVANLPPPPSVTAPEAPVPDFADDLPF
ncbi:MAG: single-stranded DNA-binding protein [Bacteroidetes bacterium]|nr:single-stranded DNA-binding protein [Bacteroidota bacterium]MCL2302952.1 single-stranded DNA-binding protein [Lentimicrobiaceae bacterium]